MHNNIEVGYNSKIEGEVVVTRVDAALNWFRKNSLWPMPMGLACCAIELMAAGASRFDISRFGMEVMRFSPRQSDCMIVAGTVTYKMAMSLKRIYDTKFLPKYALNFVNLVDRPTIDVTKLTPGEEQAGIRRAIFRTEPALFMVNIGFGLTLQ